jgi:hypothetical protein
MVHASAQRFGAGTTYTGEERRSEPQTTTAAQPSPGWQGALPDQLARRFQVRKSFNIVGAIALTVSVIGSVSAGVALITLATPPIASGVLLIVSWVWLPIAFMLGVSGSILPGKTKASSIAALVISVAGGIVSAYVSVVVLMAMGHTAIPN